MAYQVKNFMYLPNLYVKEDESLCKIEKIMRDYETDRVFVIDEKYALKGFITSGMLKKLKISGATLKEKNFNGNSLKIISAYPQNNMAEVLKIMQKMGIKYLPVCKSPHEKKLVGFVKNENQRFRQS